MSDYPVPADTLTHAMQAALAAVGGELVTPELVSAVLVAAAPHIAAGALLDWADGHHEVCEPEPHASGAAWQRWHAAHAARVAAARIVNWEHADELLHPDELVAVVRRLAASAS